MSPASDHKKLQHLFSRAAFGIRYKELLAMKGKSPGNAVEQLFSESENYKHLDVISQENLREKMTFFWHGHFACRAENPIMAQDLNNIHRKHALGNFRDMLIAVSKSP